MASEAPKRAPESELVGSSPKRPCARKEKPSSLGVHTDGRTPDDAKLSKRGFTRGVIQSGLHAVETAFVAGLVQAPPAAHSYRKLDHPEQFRLRRIHVPAGALVVWGGYTPHANENPSCRDPTLMDCEFDLTARSTEELKAKLDTYGIAVFLDVLSGDEQRLFIEEMVSDLKRSAPPGTPTEGLHPPGSIGCMICKCYGLGNTLNAQKRRLNPRVRGIYAGLYGVEPMELTHSADAFTWKPPPTATEKPLRCGQFICWAPSVAMDPGDAAKKLKWMKQGKSLCHNPFDPRSGGGPGHMSNPKFGNPGHWTTLFDPVTKEQMQALGCVV